MKLSSSLTKGNNTGKTPKEYNPGPIRGGFLIPVVNSIITPANQVAFATFLTAQLNHDDPNMRWHHIGPFESFDDKKESPQTQTLGYGKPIITDRGKLAHEFTYLEGGFAYHQDVMSYNGKHGAYRWLEYDSQYNIIGTQTNDGTGNMTGNVLSQIFAYDVTEPNRTTIAEYRVRLGFMNNDDRNKNRFVLNTGFDIQSAVEGMGVQDVVLQAVTPDGTAAGTYHIAATTGGGTTDMVNLLQSTLATSSAWLPTNAATGAAITITSVSLNATKTAVVLVLDKTDTDYPTGGANISFTLAAVSVLAGLGMKYYEATPLLIPET